MMEKKREQGKGERGICPGGRKDCLWIERRQIWPIDKCWVIKVNLENPC